MTTSEVAPKSLTENAYAVLRADIPACRPVPGARLKIADLCQRLDVSLGAVREALSRLTAEGLGESEAQKGLRVAPVSADDLDDLTRHAGGRTAGRAAPAPAHDGVRPTA